MMPKEGSAQQKVTLEECRQMALRQSTGIGKAEEVLHAAEAKQRETMDLYLPQVFTGAGAVHSSKNIQPVDYDRILGRLSWLVPDWVRNRTVADISSVKSVGAVAIQPLFMGGKILNANKMAKEAVELRKQQVRISERQAVEEVEDAYWLVVGLEHKVHLAEVYSDMLEKAHHDVELLVKEGIATKSDLLTVEVKQGEADLNRSRAEEGLALARMLLATKCGLDPNTLLYPLETPEQYEGRTAPLSHALTNDEQTRVVEALPEMAALYSAEKIAHHKVKVEQADLFPKLSLVAGATYSSPQIWQGTRHRDWGGNGFVGVALTYPLTGALSASHRRAEANAEWRQQQIDTQEKRRLLKLKLKQAEVHYEEALKLEAYAEAKRKQAEESLRLAEISYREGLIPLLKLTEAQTLWISIEDAYKEALISKQKATSELYRLTHPDANTRNNRWS